jgi:hypothetical protein
MMEEEFYAVIKLVSSEEIFSKVCVCEENHKTILILDNPVVVELISVPQMGITGLKMNPWVTFSKDSTFLIEMDKIITISEVTDEDMLRMYHKFLRKTSKGKASSKMGYLSSVEEARRKLENIYNKKE